MTIEERLMKLESENNELSERLRNMERAKITKPNRILSEALTDALKEEFGKTGDSISYRKATELRNGFLYIIKHKYDLERMEKITADQAVEATGYIQPYIALVRSILDTA